MAGASTAEEDMVLFWVCLGCNAKWHRFSPEQDPRLYAKAAELLDFTS